MKVILAKNKITEFELELDKFKKLCDLQISMREFKQKNFPDRNPKSSCFEFYLQFLPPTYTLDDILPLKGFDKDYYIRKFGDEIGLKKWNKVLLNYKKRGTLQWYVDKYGKDDGLLRYKEKNKKLSVSEASLRLNGYDDVEIKDIKKKHSFRSTQTLNSFVDRYGDVKGCERYLKYISKLRTNSYFNKQYWIKRGYTEIEAAEILKKNSTHDLVFFIDKYGEKEGTKRYEKMVKSQIWKSGSQSKPEKEILKILDEYHIRYTDSKRILSYFVDIFLDDYNTIIEFFGDYWHCNPLQWNSDSYHPTMKMTASDIWKSDQKRIDTLKELGYNVLIIWEQEFYNLNDGGFYENYIKTIIE